MARRMIDFSRSTAHLTRGSKKVCKTMHGFTPVFPGQTSLALPNQRARGVHTWDFLFLVRYVCQMDLSYRGCYSVTSLRFYKRLSNARFSVLWSLVCIRNRQIPALPFFVASGAHGRSKGCPGKRDDTRAASLGNVICRSGLTRYKERSFPGRLVSVYKAQFKTRFCVS